MPFPGSNSNQPFWRQRNARPSSSSSKTPAPTIEEVQAQEAPSQTQAAPAGPSSSDISNTPLPGHGNGYYQNIQTMSEMLIQSDLDSLNASLQIMCYVFPDVRPEVFRELLITFSPESRLQLAVESVLKGKKKLVKGRWRVDVDDQKHQRKTAPPRRWLFHSSAKERVTMGSAQTASEAASPLPVEERFRTEEYKAAVKSVLYQEFKALSRSTVKAVLAEHNYSYTNSRPTLIALTSKSWRWSLANLFSKRNKTSLPADHPLFVWHPSKSSGVLEPSIRLTPSEELNHELEQTLIEPLHARRLADQLVQDRKLAQQTNEAEAEEFGAMFDCQCCFTPSPFEYITTCTSGGHFMCARCVTLTLGEAVFGQGWASSVDAAKSTLRCFALSDDGASQECGSCIPRQQVKRALCAERDGEDTWKKFEDRLASDSLISSGAPLSKCAFCSYAEINEPIREPHATFSLDYQNLGSTLWISLGLVICISILAFVGRRFSTLFPLIILLTLVTLKSIRHYNQTLRDLFRLTGLPIRKQPEYALHHGQRFACRNPVCSKISCLRCSAPWQDIHICHRSARLALRTYIESAVTEAVKRTCPKCHVSFIKASGCNKLVCICGYSMCYLCRKEIGPREGYAHFCPHFRANPGEDCDQCDRCDLYRAENEDVIIEQARARAIKEWEETQGEGGGSASKSAGKGKFVSTRDLDLSVNVLDDDDDDDDDNEEEEEDDDDPLVGSKTNTRWSKNTTSYGTIKRNNNNGRFRSVLRIG